MTKSNFFKLAANSSPLGKGINESSLTGVKSCLLGGLRTVKCIKSTAGSAFSKFLIVLNPVPGSPETNITRKRSRTPLIRAVIRLLSKVNSEAPGSTSTSKAIIPSRSSMISISAVLPTSTSVVESSSPSALSVTGTDVP